MDPLILRLRSQGLRARDSRLSASASSRHLLALGPNALSLSFPLSVADCVVGTSGCGRRYAPRPRVAATSDSLPVPFLHTSDEEDSRRSYLSRFACTCGSASTVYSINRSEHEAHPEESCMLDFSSGAVWRVSDTFTDTTH